MTTNDPASGADILSMLDSIEEAIEAEVSWSDLPPPPGESAAEASTVVEVRKMEPTDDAGAHHAARAAFAGIADELRRYPDPPPRPAGIGKRTYAKTSDVLAAFKWGGG